MTEPVDAPEPQTPALVFRVPLEGAVQLEVVGCDSRHVATRLGAWTGSDPRRRDFLVLALELALPRPGDLDADDEVMRALAETLERVPTETAASYSSADPLDAVAPAGSLQGRSLRAALSLGDAGRAWVRWAAAQPWPLDPRFREAVLEVARREGLLETPTPEDGTA